MKTQHTPIWTYDGNKQESYSLYKNGEFVSFLNCGEDDAIEIIRELNNGASAPAMLEALENLYEAYENPRLFNFEELQKRAKNARKIINQAKGL